MGRWAAAFLAVLGLGLLPWTLWLGLSLPSRKLAKHWDIAWVGFDLVLALSLVATAFALMRRSPLVRSWAAATGALLVADAWFDIVTSASRRELWFAVGLAIVGELPVAGLCFALARPSRPHSVGNPTRQTARFAGLVWGWQPARQCRCSRIVRPGGGSGRH